MVNSLARNPSTFGQAPGFVPSFIKSGGPITDIAEIAETILLQPINPKLIWTGLCALVNFFLEPYNMSEFMG